MNSLLKEIDNIQSIYDSQEWNQINNLIYIGNTAAQSGDPSLILSFCHEFFVFGTSLKNNESIQHLLNSYNSGMSIEFAEYYFTLAYRALLAIKQKIGNDEQ